MAIFVKTTNYAFSPTYHLFGASIAMSGCTRASLAVEIGA